ncbi:putative reverse transcriptase domain-containing protein [Tanacetum coccineum]|uniref:tyrosine--tRNA ligase n=1 Tax=Tanacetum coccineum TaxID=301880 RepID=A0ABQ4WXU1_9ASTR
METGCPEEVWDKYIMEVDKGFRLVEGDAILRDFMTPGKGIVNDNRNDKFEFRVDLVPGATLVAKSPYRLAPLEMQELSEQLQEMHDKELELLKKEKLYAKKKWRVKLRRVRAMSMTIQSSIKDKILATPSETSKVVNTPAEMLRDMDQHMEKRADDGCKANVVIEALRRKEQVKPRRVRAMAMTIQFGVRGMILAAQSKAFKQENVHAERLHGSKYSVHPRADKMYHDLRDMYCSGLVRSYLALSKTKEALYVAKEAMKAMPQSAKALKLVGDVYASNSSGRDEAKKFYESALKLEPGYLRAAFALAELNVMEGRNYEACADVFFLKADICQLGIDQRKVNVLAREYCDAIVRKDKPIILSHHMLPNLLHGEEKMSKADSNLRYIHCRC